jgi:hypothetical protein
MLLLAHATRINVRGIVMPAGEMRFLQLVVADFHHADSSRSSMSGVCD